MIPSFEKKFLLFIEKYFVQIIIAALFLVNLAIRYAAKDAINDDITLFYSPWYYEILEKGGFAALSENVGDYNAWMQFIVAILTYLPGNNPVYKYKIFSMCFDFVMAFGGAMLVYHVSDKNKKLSVIAFMALIYSPLVISNSAFWGQCDSTYTCFIILALLAFFKDKPHWAFAALGVAFMFKLQAILFMPFVLFYYFYKKKFSILYFLIIPFVMLLGGIPVALHGRSIFDIFNMYFFQVDQYSILYAYYPSVWCLIAGIGEHEILHSMAMFAAIAAIGIVIFFIYREQREFSQKRLVLIALVLTYTAVMFLPSMHERYGYVYEVLAVLYAVLDKKTIPNCVLVIIASLCSYSHYLLRYNIEWIVIMLCNYIAYSLYVYHLFSKKEDKAVE